MDDALLATVLERLDATASLDQSVSDLVMAACDGDDALAEAIGGATTARPHVDARVAPRQPALAYLTSITVEGFRGVGQRRTLELRPGPGLTVVMGRNGSGKSTFAEGLELLLTGSLRRWDERSAVWKEGWRNLHHAKRREVAADLYIEGHPGTTTVRRSWEGDKLEAGTTVVQVAGERQAGIDRLGWGDHLMDYRPFLSHSELETMLSRPSDLFESLAEVLGLEDLTAAEKRLTDARKEQDQLAGAAKKEFPQVIRRLHALEDERAAACLAALEAKTWDVDTAERLATGRADPAATAELGTLQEVAALRPPGEEKVSAAAERLRAAAANLSAASTEEAVTADRLGGLLSAALEHHDHHGDGSCPVCGQSGALDASWRAETEAEVERLGGLARSLADSRREARDAALEARGLLTMAPAAIGELSALGVDGTDAERAWSVWSAVPAPDDSAEGLVAIADHLERSWADLAVAVEDVARRAGAEAARRDDAWTPVAAHVAEWCTSARRSEAAKPAAERLKKATEWMKDLTADVRNERLRPLADRAGEVWSKLRQESNVELGGMRLAGSATRRRVQLDVTVDGQEGAALGVMSQGEVNALALSVFLPRATLPASPFGFLVIDDPVQAMDPSKVEGLARVLDDTAQTRQVVVFTHDDRLPQAIRLLRIDADLVEVTRREGSAVELHRCHDPALRALDEAQGLCRDPNLPVELARTVVPGLCRTAVEAILTDGIRRSLLGRGEAHADVEARIDQAAPLMERAALALFGDAAKGGQVYGRLNAYGSWAADTLRKCKEGAHGSFQGDVEALVGDTRRLVGKLREVLG